MTFRTAQISDTNLLLQWRHQDESADWYEANPTKHYEHKEWLWQRLNNPLIRILIWEEASVPVGTVRIDSNGELTHHAENDQVAERMLRAVHDYAHHYAGRLKVTLDADDPRAAQLEAAGFTQYPARALIYKP